MTFYVRICNFIGYRFVNLALLLDTVHQYFPWDHRRFLEEDPWDMKRVTYPLDSESLVVDVGGYTGDWAMRIYALYSCYLDIYEAHPVLAAKTAANFGDNKKVRVMRYGLGNTDCTIKLYGDGMNASYFANSTGTIHEVEIKKASNVFNELYGNRHIDLLKVNVEGAEYDIFPDLLANFDMAKVGNVLIQFHRNVAGHEQKRAEICAVLEKTHKRDWNYDYIFESWSRR